MEGLPKEPPPAMIFDMSRPVDEPAARRALGRIREADHRMRKAEEDRALAKQDRAMAVQDALRTGLTLREIGRRLGLSHERVRQMGKT
jgi:DNA-binding NarL/FixJ family response regulator